MANSHRPTRQFYGRVASRRAVWTESATVCGSQNTFKIIILAAPTNATRPPAKLCRRVGRCEMAASTESHRGRAILTGNRLGHGREFRWPFWSVSGARFDQACRVAAPSASWTGSHNNHTPISKPKQSYRPAHPRRHTTLNSAYYRDRHNRR